MDSCYATRSPQVLPHQGTVIRNAVHRDLFTISLATCNTSDDFGTRLDRYLLDYSTPNSKQLWVHQLRLLIRSIRLIQANPPNQRCSTMLDKCNQPNPPIMAYDAPEHLSFFGAQTEQLAVRYHAPMVPTLCGRKAAFEGSTLRPKWPCRSCRSLHFHHLVAKRFARILSTVASPVPRRTAPSSSATITIATWTAPSAVVVVMTSASATPRWWRAS